MKPEEAEFLATALGQKFPEMSEQIRSGRVISNIFPRWGGADILDDLMRSHLPQVLQYAQHALAGAVGWLTGAWVVILIPVFAFFFLRDAERIADAATDAITARGGSRALLETIAQDLHTVLGEYVRALVLLCALSTLLAIDVHKRGRGSLMHGRPLALWAIVSALALATHYFAIFVVGPLALWLLHQRRDRATVAAAAGVGAIGAALMPLAVEQADGVRADFIEGTPLAERIR